MSPSITSVRNSACDNASARLVETTVLPSLGAVLVTTVRPRDRDQLRTFLLMMFWVIFGFFTIIRPGDPGGRLDAVSWVWVEVTLIPAIVLTGAWLAGISETWRAPARAFAALTLVIACIQLLRTQ